MGQDLLSSGISKNGRKIWKWECGSTQWKVKYMVYERNMKITTWACWYQNKLIALYSSLFIRSCAFKIWYFRKQDMYCFFYFWFYIRYYFCLQSMWPLFKVRWSRVMHKSLLWIIWINTYKLMINYVLSLPSCCHYFCCLAVCCLHFFYKNDIVSFLKKLTTGLKWLYLNQ